MDDIANVSFAYGTSEEHTLGRAEAAYLSSLSGWK